MIDGLKQEQELTGSSFSDLVSGQNLLFGTATITTPTFTTATITNFKAGSEVLSSGSKWVTFGTAFANTNYHATASANAAIAANPYSAIGTGSKAVGSFIAVGSPASATFDWIAIPRQG